MEDDEDWIERDPRVSEARHALGNRQTAVGMMRQLLLRVTSDSSRQYLQARLKLAEVELAEAEEAYQRLRLEVSNEGSSES